MVKALSQDASQTEIDFPLVTPLTQWHAEWFNTAGTFWKWMGRCIISLQLNITKAWSQTRYV